MLETPNATRSEIFPVFMLPNGDDGKRRPFHLLHCMAQPPCDATLRISPGGHGRLPPQCVAKFAGQKGWLADKHGYALCPLHKPGGAGRPPSDMPPHQKRAAFLSIRDRNMEAAASRMMKPADPVGELAKHTAAVRAQTAAKSDGPVDPGETLGDKMFRFVEEHQARIWSSRREAAIAGGFNVWTFNDFVKGGIRAGFFVQEPMRPPAARPFRFRMVDKFDPPAMQPEESAMPLESATVFPPAPPRPAAEPPPQATREDNRRIRDFLDGNFDDGAGRYCGDWTDAKAAERLRVPRAWVRAVREFYGDDRNEADDAKVELAVELVADAVKMKDEALALATRAEELERRARVILNGKG